MSTTSNTEKLPKTASPELNKIAAALAREKAVAKRLTRTGELGFTKSSWSRAC